MTAPAADGPGLLGGQYQLTYADFAEATTRTVPTGGRRVAIAAAGWGAFLVVVAFAAASFAGNGEYPSPAPLRPMLDRATLALSAPAALSALLCTLMCRQAAGWPPKPWAAQTRQRGDGGFGNSAGGKALGLTIYVGLGVGFYFLLSAPGGPEPRPNRLV
ncbi:MAG: hypothetical protein JWO31_3929, partial [Phycisphaerales bacterium]|nr:hypothetical protein [Phycisphaerales bacterium]